MNLLVLTDGAESACLNLGSLLNDNHQVAVPSDAAQALAMLAQPKRPEVVILQWPLPADNWIEVYRLLHEVRSQSFIYIVLLIRKGAQFSKASVPEWSDDIISEPFEKHELLVRIRTAFRIQQLQSDLRAEQQH